MNTDNENTSANTPFFPLKIIIFSKLWHQHTEDFVSLWSSSWLCSPSVPLQIQQLLRPTAHCFSSCTLPCLHLKNNNRKHERVEVNSLGSVPFVKGTRKSLELKSHFPEGKTPQHQNMFLLSALPKILIGVVLPSACREAQRKSYWLCDFEEGWGDGAVLCTLDVNQPRIYTEAATGLINLYSYTIKQSCIFKSLSWQLIKRRYWSRCPNL